MSRICRLCDRARDPYGKGTRKCRVCGAPCCPTCAKRLYQVEADEINRMDEQESDKGNDDLPVLPWRCSDCFLRDPAKTFPLPARHRRERREPVGHSSVLISPPSITVERRWVTVCSAGTHRFVSDRFPTWQEIKDLCKPEPRPRPSR